MMATMMSLPQCALCEIFEYLDCEASVMFNAALDSTRRVVRRISRKLLLHFEICFNCSRLAAAVKEIEGLKGERRRSALLAFFETVAPANVRIFQHRREMREVLLRKLRDYASPEFYEYTFCEETFRDKLVPTAKRLLCAMNELPFLYEV